MSHIICVKKIKKKIKDEKNVTHSAGKLKQKKKKTELKNVYI